jgi:hypothetical protein
VSVAECVRAAIHVGTVVRRGVGERTSDVYTSANDDVDMRPSGVSGWVGWIVFASMMMIISGIFSIIWGIVALARDQVFVVKGRNVIDLDYTAWGWIHLILGIVVLLAGVFLLKGGFVAGVVTIIIAMLSAIGNLLVISAYPIWSVIVIAIDVLVIYAVTVHGHELREN